MDRNRLESLGLESLHREALAAGRRYAKSEYELTRCLAAVEQRGLHRRKGCGTAVLYAQRFLHLPGHKAAELLRVGRILRDMPLVNRAWREGRLCWGKVRELTRVLTPENEEQVLDYALSHGVTQVEDMVACSPRKYRQREQARACTGGRQGAPASVDPAAVRAHAAGTLAAPARGATPAAQGGLFDQETPYAAHGTLPTPAHAAEAPARPPTPATPPAPDSNEFLEATLPPVEPMILYKNRLKPEQYALVEQAENRIRARLGRRVDRAEVLAEMARLVLSAGETRTRVRYQVYLLVDGITGQAWLDTGRGRLPAPPEVVNEALRQGHVTEVQGEASSVPDTPANPPLPTPKPAKPEFSGSVSQPPEPQGIADPQSSDRKIEPAPGGARGPSPGCSPSGNEGREARAEGGAPRRKAVPVGVLTRLFERTRGRCEDCGRRVPLDSDHLDFYSEHPIHDPDRMRLRCKPCHALRHAPHFQARPAWARARDQARRRPRGQDAKA